LSIGCVYAQEDLPESYDLRDDNYVTSIKDQGQTNYCWSFASMASLESTLLKNNQKPMDFSEYHMIGLSSDFDIDITAGGNADIATAYFTSGKGPVIEKDQTASDYYVGKIEYLKIRSSFTDNNYIKTAIKEKGAVYTNMIYKSEFFNEENNAYYSDKISTDGHHAVTIVGWDDQYPKEKFGENHPVGDGAFICKNHYGTSYGDNGYFYVSYYDYSLGKNEMVIYSVMDSDFDYDHLYEKDVFGKTSYERFDSKKTSFANVYETGNENEILTAASFYTEDADVPYSIYVVENYESSQDLNFESKVASGIVSYAGYHTVDVLETVLEQNTSFAIVIEFDNSSRIAIESDEKDYSSKATASTDESYVYVGDSFVDLTSLQGYNNSNVCLKAFTKKSVLNTENFKIENISWTNTVKGNLAGLSIQLKKIAGDIDNASLILCVYKADEQYLQMISIDYIEAGVTDDGYLNLEVQSFIEQDAGQYEMKAFLWENGYDGQCILDSPFTINVE